MANEKRWLDDEDFTPEHDKLTVLLAKNYHKLFKDGIAPILVLEPAFGGYQKYYPDAAFGYCGYREGSALAVVEIKPKIHSLGATLRQLRSYVQFVERKAEHVWLLTPDRRYDDSFEDQGYRLIMPETLENGHKEEPK